MGFKEQLFGHCALLVYLVVTQLVGVGFFQLQPDHRAWWLIGAVCVLGIITCRGRHSRRFPQA